MLWTWAYIFMISKQNAIVATTTWYYDCQNNGFYMGFGFTYLRSVTTRCGGPYASFKIITNTSKIGGYDYSRNREIGLLDANATVAFSIGFRL